MSAADLLERPVARYAGLRAGRDDRAARYCAGVAAEDQVEEHYRRRGLTPLERRWRGKGGEIDLILRDGAAYVFVEVKRARTHAAAAARVSPRQMARILDGAGDYLARSEAGLLSETRIDVATVDGAGTVEVLANAFM